MTDWLTIRQAIEQTGLADKTIRRYVTKGKLPHKRTARGHILVDISGLDLSDRSAQPDQSEPTRPARATDQPSTQQELIELRAEVDKLKGLNDQLRAERNNLWQTLQNMQANLMAAQNNQTKMLEAGTSPAQPGVWARFRTWLMGNKKQP